jgi:hypothetical protein
MLEKKRPLRKPRHRWEDNIKMDFRQLGIKGVDWAYLALDMDYFLIFVNMVINY